MVNDQNPPRVRSTGVVARPHRVGILALKQSALGVGAANEVNLLTVVIDQM
jgi:hypothetical protein